MGGCYSVSSNTAANSPVHKRPKLRSSRRSRKKYSAVNNGDTPEISSNGRSVSAEEQVTNSGLRQVIRDEAGVAPSDSGIESLEFPKEEVNPQVVSNSDRVGLAVPVEGLKEESLGDREYTLCHACHRHLQRLNRGLCERCGQFRINHSALLGLVNTGNDTYCTCGPRQPGKASTCRTHGGRVSATSAYRHASGKFREDRVNGREGNHVRSNSVTQSFADGAEKEEPGSSETRVLFQDATTQNDPRGQCLSQKAEGKAECDGAFLASQINVCRKTLDYICKCNDHSSDLVPEELSESELFAAHVDGDQTSHITGSLLELLSAPVRVSPSRAPVNGDYLRPSLEDDDDSGHGVSKSENRSESTSDLETGQRTEAESSDVSAQSTPMRFAAERALESVGDDTEEIVCPVMVKGRPMVMMDTGTYACMLNDLATLKEQLYNLSQVIQEEGISSVDPLELSLQMDQ
ncbi:uncharacterized protein LOC143294609 [Babylonia areolata]|uniref:uncharacterized protein LOC143294609 n=1 Tax=Babylonia areolata TaxID=304850 RepID=UPI003FCFB92B